MTGWVKWYRESWDHPVIGVKKPVSRYEAWHWLILNAQFEPKRVKIGKEVVTLKRGQLSHSIRYIAEAWGWKKTAVERFLNSIQTGTMIETESGTGQTIITICNYDKYQGRDVETGTDAGTDFGTRAGQQRDKDKEGKKERTAAQHARSGKSDADRKPDREPQTDPLRERAIALLPDAVRAAGADPGKDISGKWFRADQQAALIGWLSKGLAEAEILSTIRASKPRNGEPPRSLKYFDGAMSDLVQAKAGGGAARSQQSASRGYGPSVMEDIRRRKALAEWEAKRAREAGE